MTTKEAQELEYEPEQVNKVDLIAERIEQYKTKLMPELEYYVQQHNYYLGLIDKTGINEPEADPVLLGPMLLSKIERWYSLARKEAYSISGKSRDMQKFYLAVAEQAKSAQYERVRLGHYNKKMNNATDAKEIARRVSGRLEEKAAYWEGEYVRWSGIGDAYEQAGNSTKDMYHLARYEWELSKKTA